MSIIIVGIGGAEFDGNKYFSHFSVVRTVQNNLV